MMTNMGAFLDSVADKLVVCSAIVVLLAFDRVDMLVALIIVGREIAVTALREWMAKIGAAASVKVNWFGKIKTIAQMTAIPMLLYFDPIFGLPIAWIGTVLIYIAAILTIYSMCVYMSAAWPHLQQHDQRNKGNARPRERHRNVEAFVRHNLTHGVVNRSVRQVCAKCRQF